ncbi:hypothetical protein [Lacibacter cauensis]|nr:hypothetical protein [Lacibacter cauensis]
MRYNILIGTKWGKYNILLINGTELDKVLNAYEQGKETIFVKGNRYSFNELMDIQIFQFERNEIETADQLLEICRTNNLLSKSFIPGDHWISEEVLKKLGKRVTEHFIEDEFGHKQKQEKQLVQNHWFVEPSRIEELANIKNQLTDFTKLCEFCRELNIAYSNEMYLAIPMIVRAIIDHIPPVFGKSNFAEVCGGYGTKSFRDSMNNLDKSSRKIADAYLHTSIRAKEVLPNRTQVNFKHDLDVLLQEIERINKT